MNRLQGASMGYNEMVSQNPVGWVGVAFAFLAAFFLIGYLVVKNKEKKRIEAKRRKKKKQPRERY